jgi:hypothetical protein
VLKLDFRKAFDMVSSECLFKLLHIRGFNHKWIIWIQTLTETAKISILINGILGPWIQIKRGLRQGDPLYSLLFIIIVDALQKTIQGRLKHPLVTDQTCHVIQYADDTLILKQGCPNQARLLKEILDDFSMTTWLS